jgi:hypothetical protein
MKLENFKVGYHRNGVQANGFNIVLFDKKDGKEFSKMVAIVFPEPGNIAVLNVDLLHEGNILFGENSWRGDEFEKKIREVIGGAS